ADIRKQNPLLADQPDASVLYAARRRPDFDPAWLNPVAPPPVAEPELPVAQTAEAPVDTSFSSALFSGLAQPVQAIGETIDVLGEVSGIDLAQRVGETLKRVPSPENYEQAGAKFVETFDPRYLPRAVVEQLGQVAGSIASAVLGRAVGAAAGGAVGAAGG